MFIVRQLSEKESAENDWMIDMMNCDPYGDGLCRWELMCCGLRGLERLS